MRHSSTQLCSGGNMSGGKMRTSVLWLVLFMAVCLVPLTGYGQIYQVRPLDISSGIKNGTAHVTVVPSPSGDSLRAFDGNSFTELAAQNSDSLIVTLTFDSLVHVEKCKVFFWNYGKWTVEGADSLSDLENKTGTYTVLVDSADFAYFIWDSLAFTGRDLRCLRLRARNTNGNGVYLGEWSIENTVTFTRLVVFPNPPMLVPGTVLPLHVMIQDDQHNLYSYFLNEPLDWGTTDPAIATIDANGNLTGKTIGTTTVTVATDQRTLVGDAPVSVVADFHPQRVAPMTIKVALVLQDPNLQTGQRIHQMFGWRDPRVMAQALARHFLEVTDSVVNFQFTEIVDGLILFTYVDGQRLSISRYVQLLNEPGWATLRAESDSGHIRFDYREMVRYYNFDTKRNNGQIDEVWVYTGPFLGMYESQLMGPNAFWWNSPPIRDGTALTKLLSVMGLNYERGDDQAFHSFGHRVESAMSHAYENAQGKTWNPRSVNPTPWDLYTRINKDVPDGAHVGNIHFPPNGMSDYDYGNTTVVSSYAQNWYRYPYLLNQTSNVSVSTWYYTVGDPLAEGQDHIGYLRWWYGHLPRYEGVNDGVLNNWWHYALDFEAAESLAKATSPLAVSSGPPGSPVAFALMQNYPNPFNPNTMIQYTVGEVRGQGLALSDPAEGGRVEGSGVSMVRLSVYDLLGREVAVLVNEAQRPGSYTVRFDGSRLASGVYFCSLRCGGFRAVTRMLLLR